MRLLGLALFTLLVMGLIQFALVKDDQAAQLINRINDDRIKHDLVSELPADACDHRDNATRHTFIVRESDTWMALAGSPGYQKARFNLPKEARVESGALILDLSAQLEEDGIARLRVAINGARRGEVILSEGESRHEVRINLLPSDLTKSVLEVGLMGNGRFPDLSCAANWDGGMVVRIEPTSRIVLNTSEPLRALEDRLRATGNPVQVIWPDDAPSTELGRLIRFASDQRMRGTRTEFQTATESCPVAVSLSPEDLDHADIIAARAPMPADVTWPMEMARMGPNSKAQFFEDSNVWRLPYDLRGTPDAQLPTHFDLDMSVVGVDGDESWMLSVTLNGAAIHTETVESGKTRVKRSIALPRGQQGFSNMLEVHLINANPQESHLCAVGAPVMGQLEPGTVLRGGVDALDPMPAAFINALPSTLDLKVATELNAAEATAAVAFLSDAFGDDVRWQPVNAISEGSEGAVDLVWRTGIVEAAERMLQEENRMIWLLWPKIREDLAAPYGLVRVTSPDDIAHYPLMEGARIAALVTLPASKTDAFAATFSEETTPVMPKTDLETGGAREASIAPEVKPTGAIDLQWAPKVLAEPTESAATGRPTKMDAEPISLRLPDAPVAPAREGERVTFRSQSALDARPTAPTPTSQPEMPEALSVVDLLQAPTAPAAPAREGEVPAAPVHPAFLPAKSAEQASAKPSGPTAQGTLVAASERPVLRPRRIVELAAARNGESLGITPGSVITLSYQD